MATWFLSIDKRADFRLASPDKKIDYLAQAVKEYTDFLIDENTKYTRDSNEANPAPMHYEKPADYLVQFDFGALVSTRLEIQESRDKQLDRKALLQRLAQEVYKPLSQTVYPVLGIDYHQLTATVDVLMEGK